MTIDHIAVAIKTKRRYEDGTISAFLDTGYFTKSRVAIPWREDLDAKENATRAVAALCWKLHLKGAWVGAMLPGKTENYVFVNLDSFVSFQS